MPYIKAPRLGRTRLIAVTNGANGEDAAQATDEAERVERAIKARAYYEGVQYDAQNDEKAAECGVDSAEDLPEHERVHNYSTHVSESVDFVADQLSTGFTVRAVSDEVQEIMDATYAATDALTSDAELPDPEDDESDDDDDEEATDITVTCDAVLREALIGSDVPYEVKWDPFEGNCYLELWESENVEFVNPFGMHVSKVIRREQRWVTDPSSGERKEVEERIEYALHLNELGREECRRDVYWDEQEEPNDSEWLGLPIIPWGLMRAVPDGLRGFRGRSFISSQVMDSVKRFDALEQYAFQIARYNSHGNLVTVGDASALQIDANGGVKKDVADVVSFPEGTRAFALHLPTDPEMIEHQRKVLEEAIYKKFGLTRVEPDTLDSLGDVSGYALEILNRKSAGTLSRVARQFKKDWKRMVNLIVDVYAYRQAQTVVISADGVTTVPFDPEDPDADYPEGLLPLVAFWDIDPAEEYPDRGLSITMGTGYIVDEVAIRDDFTAKLISQQEALRKRGYTPSQIKKIMGEMRDSSPTEGQISEAARAAANAEPSDDTGDENDDSGTGRSRLASTASSGGSDE